MSPAAKTGTSGIVLVVLGLLSAAGKLRRNPVAGIRLPSTMRSREAWLAGHKAAATALTVAGVGPMAAGVVMAMRPAGEQGTWRRMASLWTIGWLALATWKARRAAIAV